MSTVRESGHSPRGACTGTTPAATSAIHRPLLITLNGERFELDEPLSVQALLAHLEIDPRRVAVEHNLEIVRRHRFPEIIVSEGDRIEIVNFVGGG